MLGRLEVGQGEICRELRSLDRRLGYPERNQGKALYPMYNDYAQRGVVTFESLHPNWFQYPVGGYTSTTTVGLFTDYSPYYGYGQDQPFGGDASSFGGGFVGTGGAGPSGAGVGPSGA